MKYVNDYGNIVRMSERNYMKYLKAGATSHDAPNPSDYGKSICNIDFHSTDVNQRDFRYTLWAITKDKSWIDNETSDDEPDMD